MLRCYLLLCCFLSLLPALHAQVPTQTIRGTVRDRDTKQTLTGATIRVDGQTLGAISDANGAFEIKQVRVGRVHLVVQMIGYEPYSPEDALLLSTKELTIEVEVAPSGGVSLTEAVFSASNNAFEPVNELAVVSARSFTVDETERIAAGVNDPGRVALSYPGVQKGADDTENQIVVRGNSPIGVLWRLEGIDIPNPNHFALIGSSGGGLTVFSAQLLSRSDFFTGAMPAEYGNALSGAFDMHFRHGNTEQREHHLRVGILGLDAATEGPIRRGRSSYLINYRYSTLGLLNKMGFNLVGERVSNDFQDLSFNLAFKSPNNKRVFTVFGISGISEEHYYPVENAASRNLARPDHSEDRVKPANMGVVGTTCTWLPDTKSYFKAVFALMASEIQRQSDTLNDLDMRYRYETQRYIDRRAAFSLAYSRKISPEIRLKTGLIFNHIWFDFFKNIAPRFGTSNVNEQRNITSVNGLGSTQMVQQYAQIQWEPAPRWTLNAGYHLLHLFANGSSSAEPRLSARYQLTAKQRLSFAYGLHGKTLPLMAYYASDTLGNRINNDLKMLKNHQLVLGWNMFAPHSIRLTTEVYAQRLLNVPVEEDGATRYWMLNFSDGYPDTRVVSRGKGWNYGIDAAIEKPFSHTWFLLLNGSLFASRFQLPGGIEGPTVFDTRFSSTATAVKEFPLRRGTIIQVGARYVFSGGLRYTPLDPAASAAAGRYIPNYEALYAGQTPAFQRLDVRFAWRYNRRHLSGSISLDIQNVLNRPYATQVAYDPVHNVTYPSYRGELIPLLAFQVDF
jgi:carbon monoxide dehydrogenase subunit G